MPWAPEASSSSMSLVHTNCKANPGLTEASAPLPNSSHRAACLGQVCIMTRSCCLSYYKMPEGFLLTPRKRNKEGRMAKTPESTKNLNSLLMGTPKPQPSAEQQSMKKIGIYQKRSPITKDIKKEPERVDGRRGRLAIKAKSHTLLYGGDH